MLKPVVSHLHARVCSCIWDWVVASSAETLVLQHPSPALNTGTHTDPNSINSTMGWTSLLQPGMAGREVRRELEADGTGVG